MLVSGAATLLAFVVLVAPGALWLWRAERRHAVTQRSQLMEGAIVALASAVFSLPASIATVAVLWALDRDLSTMRPWLDPNTSPSPQNAFGYLALLGLELGLALGLAWLIEETWGADLVGSLNAKQASAWQHVMRDVAPEGSQAGLDIWLTDGTQVTGVIDVYTPDLAAADREIVLQRPITHKRPDGSVITDRVADRFVVPGGSVVAGWFVTSSRKTESGLGEAHRFSR